MEPVTLLQFTPLCTDGYGSQSYERCHSGYSSTPSDCAITAQEPPVSLCGETQLSMDTGTNPALGQSPYSYVGSNSCDGYAHAGLGLEQNATYCIQQEQMQTIPPMASNGPTYDQEYGVLMSSANDPGMSDMSVGPPPIRLPRLDGPMSIDTTVGMESGYHSPAGSRGGSLYSGPGSTPHSPMNMSGDCSHPRNKSYGLNNKAYQKVRSKNSRVGVGKMVRATSPMFPDQSTPLSNLRRQPSVGSITSNKSMDQLSTFSASAKSDSCTHNSTCESVDSPVPSTNSPAGFEFSPSLTPKTQGSLENSSRSCLELEIPAKYARKISELDKKIMKLQVERTKQLEKAQQTMSASAGPMGNPWCVDMDSWMITEKLPDVGKTHLYIFPLGIHELDAPLYDDANRLLRQVGGLYLDLQTSINILRSICCKSVFIPAEISTCFAYIKSLLKENQELKLSNMQGVYSIQVEKEEGVADAVSPTEFSQALTAANNVLKCAQHITQSYPDLQMQLLKTRQVASRQADNCDAICEKLGVVDKERRGQIRALLEGNCITMTSAERVWPQYYHIAMQTIKDITECMHPSTTITTQQA